jgi:alkylhydroperoxidase family enzyme
MFDRHTFGRVAAACACLLLTAIGRSEESATSVPRPIPLTRPEMKQYLEDMKERTPRIPLPELTEEEKASLDERGRGYESRLRSLYLPEGWGFGRPAGQQQGGGQQAQNRPRDNDPAMTLDNKFKVSLFWIVSRTNNCQYCLGHQETKLLNAGMSEDEIAALDCDWASFSAAEQAAFAFARRFTLEPHQLSDEDIAGLKKHFTDMQILEMVMSMAGNNAINRWKEGVGVPQSRSFGNFGLGRSDATAAAAPPADEKHSYLTPTSERFLEIVTSTAPLTMDGSGKPTRQAVCNRPPLESRDQVERALDLARVREPRLPLVEEAKAREILGEDAPQGPLPQWARLLANFPVSGKRSVASIVSNDAKGELSPLLKAQVSWIVARQDRAWYATGQAQRRLRELGQSDDQIFALDGDWAAFSPTDRALFTVARKLAASPVVLTDDDVATAVKLAGPRDVVQLVSYTTSRASFNRITEAAGLQIEP